MAPYFSAEGMLARAALGTAVPESGYAWPNARICDHESGLKSDKITLEGFIPTACGSSWLVSVFCFVCVCVYAYLVPCLFSGENLSVRLLKSHRKQLCVFKQLCLPLFF